VRAFAMAFSSRECMPSGISTLLSGLTASYSSPRYSAKSWYFASLDVPMTTCFMAASLGQVARDCNGKK